MAVARRIIYMSGNMVVSVAVVRTELAPAPSRTSPISLPHNLHPARGDHFFYTACIRLRVRGVYSSHPHRNSEMTGAMSNRRKAIFFAAVDLSAKACGSDLC